MPENPWRQDIAADNGQCGGGFLGCRFLNDAADALKAIDQLAARRSQVLAVLVAAHSDEDPETLGEVQLVDSESGDRVDVDLSPDVIEAFRARRVGVRKALQDRLARHGSRLMVTWSDEDLLTQVLPSLTSAGLMR